MILPSHPDRKSKMELNEVYFWTNSIKDWHKIIWDSNKEIIVNSLRYLVSRGKVKVFSFVIMPNHIHLIWKNISLNGKELPNASFSKFTSHEILKNIQNTNPEILNSFGVNEKDRKIRIWNRDPLAVLMDSRYKVEQKIRYIHENPLTEKWSLATSPEDYYWSSARFYETGIDQFGFLTHYMEEY